MTWRIVEITGSCKLEYKLNYLVVRTVESTRKVFVPEIAVLIIESTAVSITAALLCELTKRKIKVIFCDEKHNPYSELSPYYGAHDVVRKLRKQLAWKEETIRGAWTEIVRDKISKQGRLLLKHGHVEQARILETYLCELREYDSSNREGHAAKVYFNTLFGNEFSRGEESAVNSALDYGYSVLLSAFSREITSSGYYTEVGIFHDNTFNQFNLSCDLMEPFRPLVDERVIQMSVDGFGTMEKRMVADVLNATVYVDGRQNYLLNAIKIYVQSFFDAMENNNLGLLKTYEVEVYESDGVLRSSCGNVN